MEQPTIIIKDPTKADTKQVAEMIKSVLDAMKEAHRMLYKEIETESKDSKEKTKEVKEELKASEKNLKGMLSELKIGSSSELKDLSKRLVQEVKDIYKTIDNIPQFDSSEIETRFAIATGELSKKLSAIKQLSAEEIRNSLESLSGDDRLDKKAIKGIEELEDEIRRVKGMKGGVSGGGKSRDTVRYYDGFSLDGSTKVFTIPAVWKVLAVFSSSFPFIFKATTDYTWTSTQLTFTSAVDATTTLDSTQTLVMLYAEI